MTLKLRNKIVVLAVASALLPVLVMTIMISVQKIRVYQVLEDEIRNAGIESLAYVANDFYKTCEITNRILLDDTIRNANTAVIMLRESGGISLSRNEKVEWTAVNQSSQEKLSIDLPVMMLGKLPLEKNFSFEKETPVIDRLMQFTGGKYTIFQRMNDRGDMLRVATNVSGSDLKRRAVGTYIPAVEPDGKNNPVIETLLRGDTFKGSAIVVDNLNIAVYVPLKDKNGAVFGCVYSGIEINAISMIKDMIRNYKIGKSGYIAVLGGAGVNKGRYIVAHDISRENTNLLEVKDSNGVPFIREIIDAGIKEPGKIGYRYYSWKNAGDKGPREKCGVYIYFAPWDWLIMPSMYLDDYEGMSRAVNDRINLLLRSIVVGGMLFLLGALFFAWYMGNKISRPIIRISDIAGMIAKGNIDAAMQGFRQFRNLVNEEGKLNERAVSRDETGYLIRSIYTMTRNLNSLVGEVQKATIHLVSTATQIAASSREQEATVSELGSSTNEIVSSSKEISSTSQQLVNTMNEVAEASSNAAVLAEAGRTGLYKMETSMEQLATATASISSKLAIINEKTSNIGNVIATITKVADQTNLLSLNASIEAEKAGEFGKGFAVVAREIRRLADQTAVATLDIVKMVKEMQSAVSSGVMGMDKFTEEVRQSVRDTDQINVQLEGIIKEVQILPDKFDQVIDGMKQQTVGAQQISDSMIQLSECAGNTSESLRSFNEAATQLNDATLALQKEVAIFKVK